MAVNAEGALRDWVNSQTVAAAPASPLQSVLTGGADLATRRGTGEAPYAVITRIGGPSTVGLAPVDRPRFQVEVLSSNRKTAERAAVALSTALEAMWGAPVVMGVGTTATCRGALVESMVYSPGLNNTPRYVLTVSATFSP